MHGYNFITSLRDNRFSLTEDYNETKEDISSLLSSIYRVTGSDKIVDFSQRVMGPLEDRVSKQVKPIYAAGASLLVLGITTGQPKIFYIAPASAYALGLLHHYAMNTNRRRQNHEPIQLNIK